MYDKKEDWSKEYKELKGRCCGDFWGDRDRERANIERAEGNRPDAAAYEREAAVSYRASGNKFAYSRAIRAAEHDEAIVKKEEAPRKRSCCIIS